MCIYIWLYVSVHNTSKNNTLYYMWNMWNMLNLIQSRPGVVKLSNPVWVSEFRLSHQSSTWVCLEKRHTAKLHVWGKWCLWIWGCPIFRQTHPFLNQNVLASIADGQVSQSLLRPFEELGPKPDFLALRGTEPAEHTIQSCMYIYI